MCFTVGVTYRRIQLSVTPMVKHTCAADAYSHKGPHEPAARRIVSYIVYGEFTYSFPASKRGRRD